MPYESVSQLPKSVKDNLPKHAQEIYQAAFNSAWDTYEDPADRDWGDDRETVAHKVAWSAVKHLYTKAPNGHWAKKE